jgi:DNA-binding transcriptional MerR regulator
MDKSQDAFRTISEAAEELDVPQHVLRFWETRFSQIRPMKRGGGRRYYRPEDMALLHAIRRLLYGEGYTIKGVQRILKEQGVRAVVAAASGQPAPISADAAPGAAERRSTPSPASFANESFLRDALADLRDARAILVAARAA